MDDFLKAYGISKYTLKSLSGGANNRVFCVETPSQTFILKQYFQHPEDKRQRLSAEFSFLTFAWGNGIRCIPEPLTQDPNKNLALYSYIEGRHAASSDVSRQSMRQAIDFFVRLNSFKKSAEHLPFASEAFFSFDAYIASVDTRIEHLNLAEAEEVKTFVLSELLPAWEPLKQEIRKAALQFPQERSLSPSDFGFHNALIADEKVFFHDFEYAGWDSPVKTVCDFFCQPKIPVPLSYFDEVVSAFCPKNREACLLLLPLFRLKWCCMMLNRFVGAGKERRAFAAAKEENQLEKTKRYFQEALCRI